MSHFSKIQTHIHDIIILKKTLVSLGFTDISHSKQIQDARGDIYSVDLVVQSSTSTLRIEPIGFFWDGEKYNIITDLESWSNKGLFEFFLEKLNQEYSLNIILDRTLKDGFQKVEHKTLLDGSMKVVVQKWS
uniref:Uncharacterized protein ycf35 n=1 Tax=Antithamnion hubbsii TaxID=1005974 RepID=A0A4D6WL63_9FLOR|nr:hypothetical protein [Antithamnion hubbsii]